MAHAKNPLIELPNSLILNENGSSYFSNIGIPLKSVSGINQKKRMGFQTPGIEVPFLKTLLKKDYFEEIYSTALTLIEQKSNLQDITKLIFYSLVYNKFKPHLTEVLLNSQLVERFNLKNPTKKITHETQFKDKIMKEFFKKRKGKIAEMIGIILENPFKLIDEDDEIKEKDEKKRILKNFLQHITLKEWFLFFLVTTTPQERLKVTKQISNLMITYLGKTKIADYLGFLLIELIQNAEKASLEKIIRVKKLTQPENIGEYLKDKNHRMIIAEFAEQMNYKIEVSWKTKALEKIGNLTPTRLEIQVSNRGVIPKSLRSSVKSRQDVQIENVSLAEFYEDKDSGLGAGLGLFYISYLLEESQKQGIKFDSIIESEDDKDRTYVILRITI